MDLHTGTPYWLVRSGLVQTYPRLRHDARADVAVIGAGVTGALCAYMLARAGADVVVVDQHDVASGSTAATTGLLLYELDAHLDDLSRSIGSTNACRAYRLGLEAIDHIDGLVRSLGIDCGFARRPSLYLASRGRDVNRLAREHECRQRAGFNVELLDRREIEDRYPFSAPAALLSQGAGEIDCYRFAHALLAAATALGARVHDRTAVQASRQSRTGVRLELDTACHIDAAMVVNATGYETGRPPKARVGTMASTWACVTEPVETLDSWPDRCVIWETARPYLYIRTTDDGRVLAGGEDQRFARRHTNVSLLPRKTARLLKRVRRLFPDLTLTPDYQWAGTFATTADGLPLIGEVPGQSGVWHALGYGGNGITFGVIAAAIVTEAYMGRRHPDAGLLAIDR